jgi:hypothetical protein
MTATPRSGASRALAGLLAANAFSNTLKPPHIGIHDSESVAPLRFVGFFQIHQVALADIPGVGVAQPSAKQFKVRTWPFTSSTISNSVCVLGPHVCDGRRRRSRSDRSREWW